MRVNYSELLSVTLVTVVGGLYADDWLVGASILVLWLIWKLTMTCDGMFVVPMTGGRWS
jgi:hypothetical protein